MKQIGYTATETVCYNPVKPASGRRFSPRPEGRREAKLILLSVRTQ